jgi:hypothetical protein
LLARARQWERCRTMSMGLLEGFRVQTFCCMRNATSQFTLAWPTCRFRLDVPDRPQRARPIAPPGSSQHVPRWRSLTAMSR